MCEMSEKWMAEGRAEGRVEGEEKKAKDVAISLADMGMPIENISKVVKMNIAVVKQWLEGAAATR